MRTLHADVVVVGGGSAGMPAAVKAAQGGAKVVVLQKMSNTGGNGNRGMGVFAVETRQQRASDRPLTRDEAFRMLMEFTHWRVNARLVKAYVDESASTVEWLESLGVEFTGPISLHPGALPTLHLTKAPPMRLGQRFSAFNAVMMRILTTKAKELGVEILLKTSGKKVLKDGERVAGVIAEDESGIQIQVNAKAVIISTGGFGDNAEWLKKYTGFELGRDLFVMGEGLGLMGDGIRMAWEAGAAQDLPVLQLLNAIHGPGVVARAFIQSGLMVNLLGERFFNEENMSKPTFMGNAIALQKNRCAFVIFDGNQKKRFEEAEKNFDPTSSHLATKRIEDLDAEMKDAIDQGNENFYMANSLEELADKTGISLDGLRETLSEYNRSCEQGHDDLLGKDPKYLLPVKEPKFYAARLQNLAFGTLGGIRINHRAEVLTAEHESISGLYAAGYDACSIYGDSYEFDLPGGTMGFAVNSGRMAGENAVRYIRSRA